MAGQDDYDDENANKDRPAHESTPAKAARPTTSDDSIARLRAQSGDLHLPPTSLLQYSARKVLCRHHTESPSTKDETGTPRSRQEEAMHKSGQHQPVRDLDKSDKSPQAYGVVGCHHGVTSQPSEWELL